MVGMIWTGGKRHSKRPEENGRRPGEVSKQQAIPLGKALSIRCSAQLWHIGAGSVAQRDLEEMVLLTALGM